MSRRRYRYNTETKEMEEIGEDWTDVERRASTVTEELVYGNLGRSTDGADISTRRRHREYMKAANVTLASDFTETWAKASKEREQVKQGNFDRAARREAIGRALYEQSRRRK